MVCASTRGTCSKSIDKDPATYSWLSVSGTIGDTSATFSYLNDQPICGVTIDTNSALGTGGSTNSLSVKFKVGGGRVSGMSGTMGGVPLRLETPGSNYDITAFVAAGKIAQFSWGCISAKSLELVFSCSGFTHWPINELHVSNTPGTGMLRNL
jgi:hypothetical protein